MRPAQLKRATYGFESRKAGAELHGDCAPL